MFTTNCYYAASVREFLNTRADYITGKLNTGGTTEGTQKDAWDNEVEILQEALYNSLYVSSGIVFEYTIPRFNKRIDVLLLIHNIIFVLEFKSGKEMYVGADRDQVIDYAYDLKDFHEESANKIIVPVLIATEAQAGNVHISKSDKYDDYVYMPISINKEQIIEVVNRIVQIEATNDIIDLNTWLKSRYAPTPTIVQAAQYIYHNHTVENITKTKAEGSSLQDTTDYIKQVIEKTKNKGEKSICFVTGIPGAGKTLVGLNLAISDMTTQLHPAVYLSGNGPLVKVLQAAVISDAKSKKEREMKIHLADAKAFLDDQKRLNKGNSIFVSLANEEYKRKAAEIKEHFKSEVGVIDRGVHSFIQDMYGYRELMLNKLKVPIIDGKLEIDTTIASEDIHAGYAEVENVVVMDEAQRCWTHDKLKGWLETGGSYGNKKKVPNFPMSEPEFLIWSMDQHKDWAVIVCLVGEGQEIHNGEAGIEEWIKSIKNRFKDWNVYVSDTFCNTYMSQEARDILNSLPHAYTNPLLHLDVAQRQFKADPTRLIENILSLHIDEAKAEYEKIKDKYPLYLTRDINTAKKWLRRHAKGTARYGIVASSSAKRLRPDGVDVAQDCDVVNWFLNNKYNLKSSYALEDVATEFDVQGLELDWTCLAWDADFRYEDNAWGYYTLGTSAITKWNRIKSDIDRKYLMNSYRVLLTRARQGMIIFIPKGSEKDESGNYLDSTRSQEYYDSTYNFLHNTIGIEEICQL